MARFSSAVIKIEKNNSNISTKEIRTKDSVEVRRQKRKIASLLKKQLMTLYPESQELSLPKKMIVLFRAAEEGDLQLVKNLIQQTGPSIRVAKNQCTLLHVAAANNQLEIVKFLLKYISANVVNKDGQTPAHLAAMEGYTEVLKILASDDEVDLNLRDVWQRTYKDWLAAPLFEAILLGNICQTKELLDLGANPDYHAGSSVECALEGDITATTARQLAYCLDDQEIIDLLSEADTLQTVIDGDPEEFSFFMDDYQIGYD